MPGNESIDIELDEGPRRWSASAESINSMVSSGFPPGAPFGTVVAPGNLYHDLGVEPEVIPPPPVPEVWARPATPGEIPGGARNMAGAAGRAGFVTAISYARGPRLDRHERVLEISDSILLRAHHDDGRRVIACWIAKTALKGKKAGEVSWSFDFAYTTTPYVQRVDSGAVREYLSSVNSIEERPHPL